MAYVKQRGEDTYLVRIMIGTDENGRPIQKSRTFHPSTSGLSKSKLQKEIDAFVEKFENEFSTDVPHADKITQNDLADNAPPSDVVIPSKRVERPVVAPILPKMNKIETIPTFAEFCEDYRQVKMKLLSPTCWQLYENVLTKYFIPMFGQMRLNEIRPSHVQKAIDFFTSPEGRTDGRGEVLKPPTIRRYLTVLQSVLTLAYKQELISSNPADTRRLEIPKVVHPEVEAFSDDEIDQILSALEEEPYNIQALIGTALFTGARRGEIVGLKWDDIDFENHLLYVRRAIIKVRDQPAVEKIPKTISSIRSIAIPNRLCEILLEYKKMQDKKIALLGEDWFNGNYVFTEWDGHVMNPQTPTKQFDHFLKRHGIRHLKFHGLRHSSATWLLAHGTDIKTVSKRLGHTSIDTTNIYVHALAKSDKAAAECFDQLL